MRRGFYFIKSNIIWYNNENNISANPIGQNTIKTKINNSNQMLISNAFFSLSVILLLILLEMGLQGKKLCCAKNYREVLTVSGW